MVAQFECIFTRGAHIAFLQNILKADAALSTLATDAGEAKVHNVSATLRYSRFTFSAPLYIRHDVFVAIVYVLPQIGMFAIRMEWSSVLELDAWQEFWRDLAPHLMATLRTAQLIIYMDIVMGNIEMTQTRLIRVVAEAGTNTGTVVLTINDDERHRRDGARTMRILNEIFDRQCETLERLSSVFGCTMLLGACNDTIALGSWVFQMLFNKLRWEFVDLRMLAPLCNLVCVSCAGHMLVRRVSGCREFGLCVYDAFQH